MCSRCVPHPCVCPTLVCACVPWVKLALPQSQSHSCQRMVQRATALDPAFPRDAITQRALSLVEAALLRHGKETGRSERTPLVPPRP